MKDYAGHKAVGYVRVSLDDKDQTTETQKREIRKWCKENDVELVEIFEDEISGKAMNNRSGLLAMIGYITINRVGLVICFNTARLARETDDGMYLKKIVREHGSELYFVNEGILTGTLEGDLRFGIDSPINTQFRKTLSANTAAGMETRARMGIHVGRPLSCTFSHNYDRDKPRISTEGKNPTKIIPMKIVIDAANQGLSTTAFAKSLKLGRWAIEDMFEKEGILETYRNVSNARRKGVMLERVETLYPNDKKSTSEESAVKGSLSDMGFTLSNNMKVLRDKYGDPICSKDKPPCEFARWALSKQWKCTLDKNEAYCVVTWKQLPCPHNVRMTVAVQDFGDDGGDIADKACAAADRESDDLAVILGDRVGSE